MFLIVSVITISQILCDKISLNARHLLKIVIFFFRFDYVRSTGGAAILWFSTLHDSYIAASVRWNFITFNKQNIY